MKAYPRRKFACSPLSRRCTGLMSLGLLLVTASTVHARQSAVRFAVIGDYGVDNAAQQSVATRLASFSPEFITTVGDNTYFTGSLADWDRTQGKYYGNFIKYPAGSASAFAGNGVTVNNFFPILGNHDWDAGLSSYTNYFELPASIAGGERYYTFSRGPVQFFMLDSDSREPDGNTAASAQAAWLQSEMLASTARWKIVQFHHPSQTSLSASGPSLNMRWDFAGWGASAVFMGHNHFYERLNVGGLPYFVNGSGGVALHGINVVDPNSQYRNTSEHGFVLADADESTLVIRFITAGGETRDTLTLNAAPAVAAPEPGSATLLLSAGGICLLCFSWRPPQHGEPRVRSS